MPVARFSRLDVVGNNTGYGLFGAIEEVGEERARAQIKTNLFGAVNHPGRGTDPAMTKPGDTRRAELTEYASALPAR
ncbi:hypothetical protein [Amycolatopsis sp. DSM 110486]|uniref:hypothetical protein n=1 Tax=Amycolatopsis sp. DSM 110486 TaxID=2865832 RepID=UPI001C69C623|nr:hypothetical protein [Amycolatopsis sp. DSM 110486]QYN20838.1 hypothetical protein K1T34_51735 [Amycolatopsis sp. DSM 110486]